MSYLCQVRFPIVSRFLLTLLLALVLPCGNAALSAQGVAATVSGFVTDGSGAKVPGATVSLTSNATGVKSTAVTNGAGLYRIAGLLPGTYRSTASMQGFKTAAREGIELRLEDQVSLDYVLDVGSVAETVTVESASSVLETESPTISQVIEGRQVEDTPLNGRNAMNLVALTPGVVAQGSTSGAASSNNTNGGASSNVLGFGNYAITGGLAQQSSVYIDGAPINLLLGHEVGLVLTQDAVQEFRVETSVVNPRYGEFGGGIISFASKSGSKGLHGTVYEYFRNNIFNANNFFNKEAIVNGAPVPRPKFDQNQFGAALGGKIPHSQAFFFFSYEGYRVALGIPNTGRVPTPAELSGDFTADAPIYDPASATTNPATKVTTEKQFSCNGVANKICPNAASATAGSGGFIDPTSNVIGNVVRYFPAPNTATSGPAINFAQNGSAGANASQYNIRLDQNLGAKQKLFARYTRFDRSEPGTHFLNNPAGPNSGAAVGARVQQYVLGDTVVLNNTSVLDLRASYLRFFSFLQPVTVPNLSIFDGQTTGGTGSFWTNLSPQLPIQVFPIVSITGNIPQPFLIVNNTLRQPLNNYVLSGTYTQVIGRHSFSFGGEARQRESYYLAYANAAGGFSFAGTATACAPTAAKVCAAAATGAATGGIAAGAGATPQADFVIGTFAAATGNFTSIKPPSVVSHYGGVFVNDTFQFSPRLTFTAGLRYELPGGYVEKHDNNSVLLPQLANPLVLVNSAAYSSRSDLKKHLELFSPRVGLSFSPQTGTTVRAGYSLSYLPMETIISGTPENSAVDDASTFIPAGNKLSNPLAGAVNGPTTILQPIGRGYANNPTYFYGQSVNGRVPNVSFPYLQQWNASLQQVLARNTTLQLAYLGARGVHEPIANTINLNQLPDQYDSMGAALGTTFTSPGQALRPYPEYRNVQSTSGFIGDTYYDSAQVTLTKRFASGGTLLGNYSWSKFLGNAEPPTASLESHAIGALQDYTNPRADKSYESFDVPQQLVISYILDLPVGRGRRLLAHSNNVVETLVSGWNATGINTFQSGFPLAITATANILSSTYGAGTIRPNVVPGCNKALSGTLTSRVLAKQGVLNAACFVAPTLPSPTGVGTYGTFGNEPRTDGQVRSEGVDNWDFSIGKTTLIHENLNLVFRAEAFNVLNRVQFGDPNLASASALFGTITTQVNTPRLLQFSLRLNY